MMAAKTQSLPTNPFSKGTGEDYSLDRPPLMDEIFCLDVRGKGSFISILHFHPNSAKLA
jgi:hypothetical protein